MGLERINIQTRTEPWPVHPMASAFRAWDKDEAKSAEISIEQAGQLEPITVYCGQVIDGANRQRTLVKLGLPIRWVDVTDDLDRKGITVEQYVLAKNISRRHLSSSERAMLVAKVISGGDLSKIVKRKRGRPVKGETQELKDQGKITASDIRELAQVDLVDAHHTVTVLSSGDEKIIEAVEQGEIYVRDASKMISSGKEITPEDRSLGRIAKIEQHLGQIVRSMHELNQETPVKGYESCRAALNVIAKSLGTWKDSLLSLRGSIRSTPSRK
jgi:hypothetical protein